MNDRTEMKSHDFEYNGKPHIAHYKVVETDYGPEMFVSVVNTHGEQVWGGQEAMSLRQLLAEFTRYMDWQRCLDNDVDIVVPVDAVPSTLDETVSLAVRSACERYKDLKGLRPNDVKAHSIDDDGELGDVDCYKVTVSSDGWHSLKFLVKVELTQITETTRDHQDQAVRPDAGTSQAAGRSETPDDDFLEGQGANRSDQGARRRRGPDSLPEEASA